MKKHIIGALVVLLLPAVCLAAGEAVVKTGKQSDANITGHVVDAKSGEHLAYATVAVKGTTIGCATDATGHYFLKNLPLGRFTLVASSVGYRSAETTVEIVADRTAEVNFSLNEEALAVEEVVVSASRTETNRKFSPTIVSVASTKLFESTASSNLAETMNFQSGLRVENNCGQLRYYAVAYQRIGGAIFAGAARQPADFQFTGFGVRAGTAARGHDRTGRGDPRRRVGSVRRQRHRRCGQHHHQGAALQLGDAGQYDQYFGGRYGRFQYVAQRLVRLRRLQDGRLSLRDDPATATSTTATATAFRTFRNSIPRRSDFVPTTRLRPIRG